MAVTAQYASPEGWVGPLRRGGIVLLVFLGVFLAMHLGGMFLMRLARWSTGL